MSLDGSGDWFRWEKSHNKSHFWVDVTQHTNSHSNSTIQQPIGCQGDALVWVWVWVVSHKMKQKSTIHCRFWSFPVLQIEMAYRTAKFGTRNGLRPQECSILFTGVSIGFDFDTSMIPFEADCVVLLLDLELLCLLSIEFQWCNLEHPSFVSINLVFTEKSKVKVTSKSNES